MCPHVFSLFSAHLFLPWHHNGKWSITKHTLQAIEVPGSYMYACTLLPLNLLSTSGSPRLSMSWVVPICMCTCIACLVPRPHAFLDINYCVGLATKLCLSPCANLAICRCCLVPKLPCADVALYQSCHVPMLPCDLLSCADVALWPILSCADVALWLIVLCQSCLVNIAMRHWRCAIIALRHWRCANTAMRHRPCANIAMRHWRCANIAMRHWRCANDAMSATSRATAEFRTHNP